MNPNFGQWERHRCPHDVAAECPVKCSRCIEHCIEAERERKTSNRLRALIAHMIEALPEDHPLAAKAQQALE